MVGGLPVDSGREAWGGGRTQGICSISVEIGRETNSRPLRRKGCVYVMGGVSREPDKEDIGKN